MSKRDDFSAVTKRTLAQRVAYRCSRSECAVVTAGPSSRQAKAVLVGVAAHITAASVGGPRFDGSLSAGERQAIENGIWLCQTCATLVDRDPDRYSVEVLQAMKAAAEKRALKLIGVPDEQDIQTCSSAVGSNSQHSDLVDYVTADTAELRNYIHEQREKVQELESDADRSERSPLGLKGVAAEARSEADCIRAQVIALELHADVIDKGYSRWWKESFEDACDCCCMYFQWYTLATINKDGGVTGNENASVRIPVDALEDIEVAATTGFFGSIVVVMMVDFPDSLEEMFASGPFDYHAFGVINGQGHEDALFQIASWRIEEHAWQRLFAAVSQSESL